MEDFSGYLTADELYDGPFCVLSLVDNRTFKRLACRVLEKDPDAEDIRDFFAGFAAKLAERGLKVAGVTTDGSPLYPAPIAEIFPGAAHQACRFHVLQDITGSVLHAVAQVRKQIKAKLPKRGRGQPAKAQRAMSRRIERGRGRLAELYRHRHLFVRKHLTPGQRATLQRITRGLPQLRVRRFKQIAGPLAGLFAVSLEKALTFLDDKLLPSTSNAVERSNRRYRKMQKSVYRVRTVQQVRRRLALDMSRDQHASPRQTTMATLHHQRSGDPKAGGNGATVSESSRIGKQSLVGSWLLRRIAEPSSIREDSC